MGFKAGQVGELEMGSLKVHIELFPVLEETNDVITDALARADAALLLVRFLDQVSMDRIKEAFRTVSAETFMPKSIAILREPKEGEFKISCTYCGQKLWVRDRDAGRRGSCPQCRKTFFIPTQKAYITSFLMLNDSVPVHSVSRGDVSCRNSVTSLAERIVNLEEGMKSSTMRIELPPDEA